MLGLLVLATGCVAVLVGMDRWLPAVADSGLAISVALLGSLPAAVGTFALLARRPRQL